MDTFLIGTCAVLSLLLGTCWSVALWLWSTVRAERAASSALREKDSTSLSSERAATAKMILLQAKQIKRLQREVVKWQNTGTAAIGLRMHRNAPAATDQQPARKGFKITSPSEAIRREKELRLKEVEPPQMQEPTTVPPKVANRFLKDAEAVIADRK